MSALTERKKSLRALHWSDLEGLVRIASGKWAPGLMQTDLTFSWTTVRALINEGLVHVTSSSVGVPRKVKCTKKGRELLSETAS